MSSSSLHSFPPEHYGPYPPSPRIFGDNAHHRRHSRDIELDALVTDDRCDDTTGEMSRSRRSVAHDDMNSSSSVEYRRKAVPTDDADSTSQTEHLIQRESFTLDDDSGKPASASFLTLSKKDQRNFLLLVLLYFLQGVPMGLAMGSVPFLLKSKLSYGEIGVFSLASYPYSMKLLWSPVVDAIWSKRMGRRKSWIVPIQTVSAVMLLWLGSNAARLMEEASQRLYMFTFVFFMLVMLCATQDVAVDGMLCLLFNL